MYEKGRKNANKDQTVQKKSRAGISLTDNRPATIQKKENNTGLPDQLKSGIENLSGHSMDDVKVHYNSSKPAQLKAHAYAQGSQIHLGAGQEKHLPHEAWHVVQQKQGRVKPTKQLKAKVNINDDAGLEKEADVMGARALRMKSYGDVSQRNGTSIRSSFKTAQLRKGKKKKKRISRRQRIQIGHRPGWPGRAIARYVTHAVFRVNGGAVLGYGKPQGGGVIAPDANIPANTRYTWFAPTLLLPAQYVGLFRQQVGVHAAGFLYTGVGGNCFTPIYKSLIAVRTAMTANGSSQHNIDEVTAVIGQLGASNFGMGTIITNKMLTGALALGAITYGLYNLLYDPSKVVV